MSRDRDVAIDVISAEIVQAEGREREYRHKVLAARYLEALETAGFTLRRSSEGIQQ